MGWVGVLFVLVPAFLYGGWNYLRVRRNLRRYWCRSGTAADWARAFPGAADGDIRAFLELFNQAFAFSRKRLYCFSPDDRVMDVYRALYPDRGCGDALETECLHALLERHYGSPPGAVWHSEVTLGELFGHFEGAET